MSAPITTYYLEMTTPAALRGKSLHKPDFQIAECRVRQPAVNKFLYEFVGTSWQWFDKQTWTDAEWQAYAEADNLRTWMAIWQGSIAGYYELQSQPGNQIEIVYFGLAPNFIGMGLGGILLTHAIQSAWAWGPPQRVWVHTCSLDHPSALNNYLARGFTMYKQETTEIDD